MSRPQQFFDQAYESGFYLEHWETRSASPELAAMVAAGVIAPGARVIDLGCGAGREALFLASLGFEVTGVDFSAKGLEIARERARAMCVNVRFLEASVLELPFADQAFDFANDRGCLHHIPEEKRDAYADEVARVLRPGGVLFLRGASPEAPETFVPITEESIDEHFTDDMWDRGPVVRMATLSEHKILPANMVMLTRQAKS